MHNRTPFGAARPILRAFLAAVAMTACGEATTEVPVAPRPTPAWEIGASVSWNRTARELIAARVVASVITQVRILAYLSVAQYNAVLAAEASTGQGIEATPALAAAAASSVVLKSFFPLDSAMLDVKLVSLRADADRDRQPVKAVEAGEVIGRSIGAQVVQFAMTDRTNLTVPPANPGGPGYWTGTNSVRGLYGARTFALKSGDQFRPAPPPAFGSAEFDAALAETRAFTDNATPAQIELARTWAPQGPSWLNGMAANLIVETARTERQAARILALANMAGFDASSACFDAKFAYYLIRPTQADPLIKLAVPLPNHPSYPSGHSCFAGSYGAVLLSEFPSARGAISSMIEDAGMSRVYGGLHYVFDCKVGAELGRKVAEYVLEMAPRGNTPIPVN